jgi:single-strand DNA-binding protein
MHSFVAAEQRKSFSANSRLSFVLSREAIAHAASHASDIHEVAATNSDRRSRMNSFDLRAIGNLSSDPDVAVKGATTYTRFCLVGNDYAGRDEQGNAREVVTSLWFVAFDGLGESIARSARKGDQLIVDAKVRSDNWTDNEGVQHFDHSFIAESFRFGAPGRVKREELAKRGERELDEMETEI